MIDSLSVFLTLCADSDLLAALLAFASSSNEAALFADIKRICTDASKIQEVDDDDDDDEAQEGCWTCALGRVATRDLVM